MRACHHTADRTVGRIGLITRSVFIKILRPAFTKYIHLEECFITDIKQNLGIMICLDKDQDDLSDIMERYPFIYNDGHLIWLDGISDSSIREIPQLIVQRYWMTAYTLVCCYALLHLPPYKVVYC